mgnify:CR=1 FL=1
MGDIVIVLTLLSTRKEEKEYWLHTQIIDTGCGISKERQEMLFEPFLELKMK